MGLWGGSDVEGVGHLLRHQPMQVEQLLVDGAVVVHLVGLKGNVVPMVFQVHVA